MLPPPRSGCSDFPRGSGRRKLRGSARRSHPEEPARPGFGPPVPPLCPAARRETGAHGQTGGPGRRDRMRPAAATRQHQAPGVCGSFSFPLGARFDICSTIGRREGKAPPPASRGRGLGAQPRPPLPGPRSRRPAPRGCAFTHPPPSSWQGEVAPKGSLPHPPPTGRGPGPGAQAAFSKPLLTPSARHLPGTAC